jgi:hypothetical protein
MTGQARNQLSQVLSPKTSDKSWASAEKQPQRECLVGTVLAVSGNLLKRSGTRVRDRLFVRVFDGTDEVVVALLGAWGLDARTSSRDCRLIMDGARLRTGQLVVFDGLKRCDEAHEAEGAGLLGDAEYGAIVWCPSALGASLHLLRRDFVLMWDCVLQRRDRFVAHAVVAGTEPRVSGGDCITEVHVDCRWPAVLSGGRWDCTFCRRGGVVVEQAYQLVLTLDDGTAIIEAEASGNVLATLLPLSAADFSLLESDEQSDVLAGLLCREVVVDLCAFWTEAGGRYYRIDSIRCINPVRSCREHQSRAP